MERRVGGGKEEIRAHRKIPSLEDSFFYQPAVMLKEHSFVYTINLFFRKLKIISHIINFGNKKEVEY